MSSDKTDPAASGNKYMAMGEAGGAPIVGFLVSLQCLDLKVPAAEMEARVRECNPPNFFAPSHPNEHTAFVRATNSLEEGLHAEVLHLPTTGIECSAVSNDGCTKVTMTVSYEVRRVAENVRQLLRYLRVRREDVEKLPPEIQAKLKADPESGEQILVQRIGKWTFDQLTKETSAQTLEEDALGSHTMFKDDKTARLRVAYEEYKVLYTNDDIKAAYDRGFTMMRTPIELDIGGGTRFAPVDHEPSVRAFKKLVDTCYQENGGPHASNRLYMLPVGDQQEILEYLHAKIVPELKRRWGALQEAASKRLGSISNFLDRNDESQQKLAELSAFASPTPEQRRHMKQLQDRMVEREKTAFKMWKEGNTFVDKESGANFNMRDRWLDILQGEFELPAYEPVKFVVTDPRLQAIIGRAKEFEEQA